LKRVRQICRKNVYDERGNLCEIKVNGTQIVGSRFIVINNNTEGVYERHSKRANLGNIGKVMNITGVIGNENEIKFEMGENMINEGRFKEILKTLRYRYKDDWEREKMGL